MYKIQKLATYILEQARSGLHIIDFYAHIRFILFLPTVCLVHLLWFALLDIFFHKMSSRGEQFSLSPLILIPGLNCPMGFLDYTRLIIFLPTTCFMPVGPSPSGPFHRLPCDMASACFQGKQFKRERERKRNITKMEATVFSELHLRNDIPSLMQFCIH